MREERSRDRERERDQQVVCVCMCVCDIWFAGRTNGGREKLADERTFLPLLPEPSRQTHREVSRREADQEEQADRVRERERDGTRAFSVRLRPVDAGGLFLHVQNLLPECVCVCGHSSRVSRQEQGHRLDSGGSETAAATARH